MMRILVFAGTGDGRVLAARLAELPAGVTLRVATEYGREIALDRHAGLDVASGRLDREAMGEYFRKESPDLVVDATHPYAVLASSTIENAAQAEGVPYLRLRREAAASSGKGGGDAVVTVPDTAAAVAELAVRSGNVLLAVGVKELAAYTALPGFAARLFPRVLPSPESLRECERLGFAAGHVIAMQGPFSRELNLAIMRQFAIAVMVTKDGGTAGGFPEKLAAAADAGVFTVVIGRPAESTPGFTADEIVAYARAKGTSP